MNLQNIIFLFQYLSILFVGMIKYIIYKDKIYSFKYVVTKLGNINIFFLKIFQSLSTNTSLLTVEQIDYLTQYTDNVPYTYDEIDTSFIEDIKRESTFELSSSVPIKSGAMALIYKGILEDEDVIIKVLRKGMREKIEDAINKISFLFSFLIYIPQLQTINASQLIEENRNSMIDQTNFKKEIQNIQRMEKNNENIDYIIVPKVYENYTNINENIIVMKYLDGKRLEEVSDEEKDDYSLLMAKFGMKCFLFNRFFHSDLHAGNVLFMEENGGKKVGILDYGLMGELTRDEQTFFFNFITAMSAEIKDIHKLANMIADELIEVRNNENITIINKKIILEELEVLLSKTLRNNTMNSEDMYQINKALYRYNLQLKRSFCKIAVAFAISDSVCKELCYKKTYLENVKTAMDSIFDMDIMSY